MVQKIIFVCEESCNNCDLLQSSNSAGLSGSIGGGAEQLFGKKRSSGYDAILSKISTVTAILFIVLSLILVAIE